MPRSSLEREKPTSFLSSRVSPDSRHMHSIQWSDTWTSVLVSRLRHAFDRSLSTICSILHLCPSILNCIPSASSEVEANVWTEDCVCQWLRLGLLSIGLPMPFQDYELYGKCLQLVLTSMALGFVEPCMTFGSGDSHSSSSTYSCWHIYAQFCRTRCA